MARTYIFRLTSCLLFLSSLPLFAEVDFTGEWADMYHEDQLERIPGPNVGDYLGLPINEAARRRADTWQASLLTIPERQCIPHPASYGMWGPANLRISKEVDPVTQQMKAIIIYGTFGRATRTIWLDGRPHPPEWAPHTWAGFSTGTWDGDMLTVKTTHIKAGYIRRNGIPTSDEVTVTEHYLKHDNILTVVYIREDPVYLTEPFIQTGGWILTPGQQVFGQRCEPAVEIANRPKGWIPHFLPGTNDQIKEFPELFGVPAEAARGGAETMYPDYKLKLRKTAGGVR